MNDTKKMKKEFQAGIDMMWQAHPDIGHKWKLPSPLSCIMYAVTECSEVLNSLADVVDGQEHYRNNPKDRNTKEEIADTIMMIGRCCMSANVENLFSYIENVDVLFHNADYETPELAIIGISFLTQKNLGLAGFHKMNERYYIDEYLFELALAAYGMFTLLDEGEYVELLAAKLQKYRKKIIGTNE